MNEIKKINKIEMLKGDKILWIAIILISFGSLFPVYSASSNLEYVVHNGTTINHLIKHAFFIVIGLGFMRFVGIVKYEYIGKVSVILLIFSIILLVLTMFSGKTIDGASASRWLTIPWVNISFQPSTVAFLCLIIHLCRYLTKNIKRERGILKDILHLFAPILLVFGLVMKDNGSTAIMILLVSIIVLVVGQYKLKNIIGFVTLCVGFVGIFLFLGLKTDFFGDNHRINTWMSRIEIFTESKNNSESVQTEEMKAKTYQVMQAKAAIVHGGITGKGPGKSALKQMLPQSASDFIFAIIVEEYGLIGTVILLFLYSVIIIRIIMIANKIPAFFGSLLCLSIGIMFFIQLAVNIAVALNLIPVTGQPLPLISYGGTSILVTYLQLGLVLNVSSRIQIYDEEGMGKKQSIEEINDIA